MMKLKVLGGLELSGDTVPEDGVRNLLAKPKLTAIVVRMMLAKPGSWCRRDTLAALFWPESDQAHARAALSQSLYQIRQHLGADVLEKRGNEDVRLAPGAITCDGPRGPARRPATAAAGNRSPRQPPRGPRRAPG